MSKRRVPLVPGEIYHIFTKTIAKFVVFRKDYEYQRMIDLLRFYNTIKPKMRFSNWLSLTKKPNFPLYSNVAGAGPLVDIIAYCVMPTHIHLILSPRVENGVSLFMGHILNSYTRYFNSRTKRLGPLWVARFKNVLVETSDQLLYLTRYIHLNPVTAFIVDNPKEWVYSSYREYIGITKENDSFCASNLVDMDAVKYKEFVNSYIDEQRELAKLKKLILE